MMGKDKQIEEMARAIGDADQRCYEMDCDDCPFRTMELGLCKEKLLATELYEKGYRKASEVARGIFEEIERILNIQAKIVCETRANYRETDNPMLSFIAMLDGRIYSLRVMEEQLAELKKKNTEGEG